jgi:uncharacterized protein (DUF1330 family)
MTAYYILTHTITDPERYQKEYLPATWPLMVKHNAELVVASFKAEVLQGNPPEGIVILRFPSEEAVRGFANDPDYQPLKKIRLAYTTNSSAVLAPEFKIPER